MAVTALSLLCVLQRQKKQWMLTTKTDANNEEGEKVFTMANK